MRPFFSYYGAKWTVAKHLGPPRRDVVIEPFAGSACYSTRWAVPRAKLYDVSEDIVALWDWLIHGSIADVVSIPDSFEDIGDVLSLPLGPSLLVRWWVSKGRAEPSGTLSPWYFEHRNTYDCKVWGPMVKHRVITQKPMISRWTVSLQSYDSIPNINAHWHIDPPYEGPPGRRYPNSKIDFRHLSEWCRSREGAVDVCENIGASWLPFIGVCSVTSSRGRRDGHKSEEAVFRK